MRALYLNRERRAETILLALILIIGGTLRWYGLAWDAGYLFHPDERQILMVASNLEWPHSILELLSPTSPLNPHFFAYGSFPIYLLRALAPLAPPFNLTGPWANDFLARWAVFGRAISGLFDLGTILLLYLLGRRMYGARVALTSAACVAVTVLNIQLSHYYTVDTLLTFFVMLTLYAAWRIGENGRVESEHGFARMNTGPETSQRDSRLSAPIRVRLSRWHFVCGLSLGLALATKVSALPLLVPIALAIWHASGEHLPRGGLKGKTAAIWRTLRRPLVAVGGIALAVFVITQPYSVLDAGEFFSAVGREALVARGWLDFPYTRQYANTIPFVYQIWQSAVWGMGLPLGICAWAGSALFAWQTARRRDWPAVFLLAWAGLYLLTIGAQYAKYPRYLLPLTPALFLMASRALALEVRGIRWKGAATWCAGAVVLGLSFFYAISFVSIYSREHPWLVISRWIYENVRPGTTLAIEEWDDALPVKYTVNGISRTGSEYPVVRLPIQDGEDSNKLDRMARALVEADVVIVASQRGYGSVGRLAMRYPIISRYYEKLFDEELGYKPAATARNDPGLFGLNIRDNPGDSLPFRIPLPSADTSAGVANLGFEDESLTVYDHPQPLVFVKTRALTYQQFVDALENEQK